MDINDKIQYLKGVGEARAKLFKKLGIVCVRDLLYFFPRAYEDWSKICPILEAPFDENCCIKGIVSYTPSSHRTTGGKMLYKTMITDGISLLNLTFFNNKYVLTSLLEGEEYLFFGKVTTNIYGGREMLSPRYVKAEKGEKIRPVYPSSENLSSKIIEKCVETALENLGGIKETLPQEMNEKYRFPSLFDSLRMIHFPESENEIEAARRRLIFEELLFLQLGLFRLRESRPISSGFILERDYTDEFLARLPFALTKAQHRAISEALSDMRGSHVMNRILQGDVGSGKTAVAAALIYSTVKNSHQCAFMAPTEVLAQQHFRSFSGMLEGTGITHALLTGSATAKQKREILQSLKAGEIDLLIGTHALIEDNVEFRDLALVITDEQHRFGVNQRARLTKKGDNPHTLVMSATPIPRTLALIIYGDLDISILDELPPGRQPVMTYLVSTDYRGRIYNFIKKQIKEGRQAFIVCPMVEEGDMPLVPATEYSEELKRDYFSDYNVGLLHGRMKPKEKDGVMTAFADGRIQLLVATVVIEVGVDVPNASVMVIENAERFGLSQIHQLRGRIGRGRHQSFCILVSDAQNKVASERLNVLCETNDGFKIADEDLKLRGPGDFFGTKQHGLPELKIANFTKDTKILYAAGKIANEIIAADPQLQKDENILLREGVEKMFDNNAY